MLVHLNYGQRHKFARQQHLYTPCYHITCQSAALSNTTCPSSFLHVFTLCVTPMLLQVPQATLAMCHRLVMQLCLTCTCCKLCIVQRSHAVPALCSGQDAPKQISAMVRSRPSFACCPLLNWCVAGASEARNLGYMTRLGLWGEGVPAFPDFGTFLDAMDSKGVAAFELVAMDMKVRSAVIYSDATLPHDLGL